MSLKAFHIFFIIVSIMLSVFLAAWEVRVYQYLPSTLPMVLVGVGVASALALGAYLVSVFKKYKNVGLI